MARAMRAVLVSVVAVAGMLTVPLFAATPASATPGPPIEPNDFSAIVVPVNVPYRGVTQVEMDVDATNRRERFVLLDQRGNQLLSVWVFHDKLLTYLATPTSCTRTPNAGGPIVAFGWLADSWEFFPQVYVANSSAEVLVSGNPLFDLLEVLGASPIDRFVTLALNGDGTPNAFVASTRHGPAMLLFEQFTSGQPDASVFTLPADCVS